MWKEALKALSLQFSGGSEEHHEKPRCPNRDPKPELPEHKSHLLDRLSWTQNWAGRKREIIPEANRNLVVPPLASYLTC